MIGTGVLAYHTDTISISIHDFPYRNMVDLFFALAAQKQKVPLICLSRAKEYLKEIDELSYHKQSIYQQAIHSHDQQTVIAKAHAWVMYKPVEKNN
jgi:hypothetical protein